MLRYLVLEYYVEFYYKGELKINKGIPNSMLPITIVTFCSQVRKIKDDIKRDNQLVTAKQFNSRGVQGPATKPAPYGSWQPVADIEQTYVT